MNIQNAAPQHLEPMCLSPINEKQHQHSPTSDKQHQKSDNMMAYEHNNLNNALFNDYSFDHVEPAQVEGKLDAAANLNMGGLTGQLQPGFIQQFNNNYNNYNAGQQPQMSLANLQMQMNAHANYLNTPTNITSNVMNNTNTNNMQPMTMNGFPQSNLMNSMVAQRPFFQASFGQQQQQQQARSVPNFISFNNAVNNCNTTKPLLASYEPFDNATINNGIPSNIHTQGNINAIHKPLFGGLEPRPVFEKPTISEPVKSSNPPPSTTTSAFPRRLSKSRRLLPADFEPSGNYVICGNKRKYFESKGNIRFREVCKRFLQDYVQAPTKIEKSAVVTTVMNILREDCPEGAFVSPQGGRWYAVSDRTAREKVGTFFRDCLSDSYKSSAKNKIARRKIIKKASANNSASNNNEYSDEGSLGSISFYDVDDLTPVPL